MADIGKAFTAETGIAVVLKGSGSGSLRKRIEEGERPDVFASADMENPAALAAKGLAEAPVPFTRNVLCVLAKQSVGMTQENILQKLLDKKVKLGTSTPVLDPGGDYAWKMFDMADVLQPGASKALQAKAIKLVGDPALPLPPKEYPRSQIAWHMEEGRADVFLVYLTTAKLAQAQTPGLEVIALPKELSMGAQYGLSIVMGAKPAAARFKSFVLGPKGQSILEGYGFEKP